ncbi:MAG: PEP-CTERM sorting domain-containing protein, partial [Opitutales bacterium]
GLRCKNLFFTTGALADRLRLIMGNFSDNASQLGTQFDGRIYDLQIYSGVLSSSEITNLMDNPGTAIPEPSTYALWAACLGLGAVLLRRRT